MGFLDEAKAWARKVAQKSQEVAKAGLEKGRAKRQVPGDAPSEVAEVPIGEVPAEAPGAVPPEAAKAVADASAQTPGEAPGETAEAEPADGEQGKAR